MLRPISRLVLLAVTLGTLAASASAQGINVTTQLVSLGTPTAGSGQWPTNPYARNPWDLHAFSGRLYVGAGDSAGAGGAGPATLNVLDLATQVWSIQQLNYPGVGLIPFFPEEQIPKFIDVLGLLTIPGHDQWAWEQLNIAAMGSFYYQDPTTLNWNRVVIASNIPHVYDLFYDPGSATLFAALGQFSGVGSIVSTTGTSWTTVSTPAVPSAIERTYNLFTIGSNLYGAQVGTPNQTPASCGDLEVATAGVFASVGTTLTAAMFPPGYTLSWQYPRIDRTVVYQGVTYYLFGEEQNDHDILPFGIASRSSPTASPVNHTTPIGVPRDLIVPGDGFLYALTGQQTGSTWRSYVYRHDGAGWKQKCYFDQTTFARSFEIVNGDLYVGMGVDFTQSPTYPVQSGQIYFLPASAWY